MHGAHDPKSESVELQPQDYMAVMRVIHELHACRSLEAFPEVVTRALSGLIPCNLAAYNEVNVSLGRMKSVALPAPPQLHELISVWERHMSEHPILDYYRVTQDGQALAISDFLSQAEFHALGLYREFFSRVGAEDQLAAGFFLGDSVVVWLAFNRSERGFSARDRQVLNLLRPHLIQAYAAAREFDDLKSERRLLQEALGSVGHGVIRYRSDGRLAEVSPSVLEALEVGSKKAMAELAWLNQELEKFKRANERQQVTTSPSHPKVMICWHRVGEGVTGIVSEKPTHRVARLYGLTQRESEVLQWMAEGKSNAEVGQILEISAGTVKIHVQRVLAKLGAPNRTAAVAMLRTL